MNIKDIDDAYDLASKFISTYSLKRDFFKIIFTHINEIKDYYEQNKQKRDFNHQIRNLIVKDYKLATAKEGEFGMKENNIPKSLMVNHELNMTSLSRSPKNKLGPKILFKINFDIGGGRVSKLVIKEGDNLTK